MSRVSSFAPLHLNSGGGVAASASSSSSSSAQRRPGTGKSLGLRKVYHTPAAVAGAVTNGSGNGTAAMAASATGRYQLPLASTSQSSSRQAAGGGSSAAAPPAQQITTFFSKQAAGAAKSSRVPFTDRSNAQVLPLPSASGSSCASPASSPDCTPPVHRSLFASSQNSTDGEREQLSQPQEINCTPPAQFPVFAAAAAAAANKLASASAASPRSCWDSTPPDSSATASHALMRSTAVPAPPMKAPRKAPRALAMAPAAPAAVPAGRRPSSPSFRPELICLTDSLDSDDSRLKPCPLNFSSQPTPDASQSQAQSQSDAVDVQQGGSGMMDDIMLPASVAVAAVSVSAAPLPFARSSSMCSDVVIQASQDAEEDEEEDAAAGASECSTPVLATTPRLGPSRAPTLLTSSAVDFSAFNESIAASATTTAAATPGTVLPAGAAQPDHRSAMTQQQQLYTEMPPPSCSPTFTAVKSAASRMFRSASIVQRSASIAGSAAAVTSSQSGLPPPVPRASQATTTGASAAPSSSQQGMYQTNLNFMRSGSSSGLSRFPSFAAAAASGGNSNPGALHFSLSQTQSQQSYGGGGGEGHGNSLESCGSMYCTPQDQPVRERTLLEMSEELHAQREGVALHNALQERAAGGAGLYNTHAQLSAVGRMGSSNSGFVAPPASKKARLGRNLNALAARTGAAGAGGGLDSMQILGSTLPHDGAGAAAGDFAATQPVSLSQQMTQASNPAAASVAAAASSAEMQYARGNGGAVASVVVGAPPFTLENPFLTALVPPSARVAAAASGTATQQQQRAGKKRALPGSSAAAAAGASSLLSSLPSSSSYLLTHFDYLRQFGVGSFGTVMLARHKLDGAVYAIKRSKGRLKGPNSARLLAREVHVMSFLKTRAHCPSSILRLENSWMEDHQLYMQLEYCEGGSLGAKLKRLRDFGAAEEIKKTKKNARESNNSFTPQQPQQLLSAHHQSSSSGTNGTEEPVGPFPEPVLLQVALQMGQALAFLHAHGLVHLDVKPDNMLQFADNVFKLADFGLACNYTSSAAAASGAAAGAGVSGLSASSSSPSPQSTPEVGDRRYLAPEALDEFVGCLPALDCFALGCSLYELASGVPFALPMSNLAMDRLRNGDIDDIAPPRLSPRLYECIRTLLHPDPAQRMTAQQLVDDIEEHCF